MVLTLTSSIISFKEKINDNNKITIISYTTPAHLNEEPGAWKYMSWQETVWPDHVDDNQIKNGEK